MTKSVLALSALLAVAGTALSAQQPVTLLGRLLDAGTAAPVAGATVELVGTTNAAVTDEEGEFRLGGVLPGVYDLQVRHLAYGTQTREVDVAPEADMAVELRLSPRALELEAIDVEVLRPVRTSSTRSNVITREQIAALADRARHVGDVVRAHIPGAAVSESRGGYLCVEFRGAAQSKTTGCNFPLVVLDGLPVTGPARFLRDLPVDDLERIEFVPASMAGARYGLDTTYGVLVIETRRAALTPDPRAPEAPRYLAYRWEEEAAGHPTLRSWGGAALGAAAGTLAGLAAIGCLPGSDGSGGACVADAGVGAGLGASVLPLVGSVLGARILGATEGSRGRLLPSLAMTAVPSLLGYAVYRDGVTSDFDGEVWLGAGLALVATPLVSTLADHLFRRRR
ncbi:MAG: hypothetical protein AMXMBFR53_20460 [Gemmatimonadota bacterium]